MKANVQVDKEITSPSSEVRQGVPDAAVNSNSHVDSLSDLTPQSLHRAVKKVLPKDLIEDVKATLPVGVQLHRAYRYQNMYLRGAFDIAYLKAHVPEHLEGALTEWRHEIEERHPTTHFFIKRIEVQQNLQNNLLNRFKGRDILSAADAPELLSIIENMCGKEPSSTLSSDAQPEPQRENLTHIPFMAFDAPDAVGLEDLVHGEREPDGTLILRTAFIDITDFITPGSERDKYQMRVGTALYGRHRVISPIGVDMMRNEASFLVGERRPAWVIECKVDPSNEETPMLGIRRAWVQNHANVNILGGFNPEENPKLVQSLAALAEITPILSRQRTRRSTFVRVDSVSAPLQVLTEAMIQSRMIVARYLTEHCSTGVIYRAHPGPTPETNEEIIRKLHSLKIPASLDDFRPPYTAVPGIIRSLEERNSRQAHSVANKLLDTILGKARFTTSNIGHFELGGIEYAELKPRSGGIVTQYLLDSIFRNKPPLPLEELNARAEALNNQRWTRDERMYTLRVLEMLCDRLADTGNVFLAEVTQLSAGKLLINVESFSKYGVARDTSEFNLALGDVVAVKLDGFNLKEMRFEFSIVEA